MTERYKIDLPESLEQLPTTRLDDMLRWETEQALPDEEKIRQILKVLRQRERDYPVAADARIEKAWERYRRKTAAGRTGSALVKVAAVLVLCCLLLLSVPQEANAGSVFQRIGAWTESVFELLDRWGQEDPSKAYRFRTAHPGLQELYDTVTELGVTAPVVPMWLEEGYELVDCKVSASPITSKITAQFFDGEKTAVIEINVYSDSIPREFHKNETSVAKREYNGVVHYIFQNKKMWTAVWASDNIECSVVIECQEAVLYRILDSIYTMED